jgi:hypothetical protein
MIHQPVSSQPRPAGRGLPRIRRWATGLTVTATAVLAGANAALAGPRPAPDGGGPLPPPPVTATAHLPLSAVVALVTATIVLSVATTLITMSLEQTRRAHRTLAAPAEPQAGTGDILASHHYPAGYDKYRAGNP